MAPFHTLFPRWAKQEPTSVGDTGYPREVMEAGWVPELAALAAVVRRGHGLPRGDADVIQAPRRPRR